MSQYLVKKKQKPTQKQKDEITRQLTGHFFGMPNENELKKINLIINSDGVYEIRKNRIGVFTNRIAERKITGVPSSKIKEGFHLTYGRIPADILIQIVKFFKDVNEKHSSEAFMQILWSTSKNCYYSFCPEQTISGASVKYDSDTDVLNEDILVLEIHSHNTMSSFFSGIDNEDEKGDRFFGVIGDITQPMPTMKFRAFIGGIEKDISIWEVFQPLLDKVKTTFNIDLTKEKDRAWGNKFYLLAAEKILPEMIEKTKYPKKEWFKKITKRTYKYSKDDWSQYDEFSWWGRMQHNLFEQDENKTIEADIESILNKFAKMFKENIAQGTVALFSCIHQTQDLPSVIRESVLGDSFTNANLITLDRNGGEMTVEDILENRWDDFCKDENITSKHIDFLEKTLDLYTYAEIILLMNIFADHEKVEEAARNAGFVSIEDLVEHVLSVSEKEWVGENNEIDNN